MNDFVAPDFDAPLDLDERVRQAPSIATVKGMFFQRLCDDARLASGRRIGRDRYVSFKDYPVREWLRLLVEAAGAVYPHERPRHGLRLLGRRAYGTFAESAVGKVVMSVAGPNIKAALRLAPRAYMLAGNTIHVELGELTGDRAVFRLRNAWDFHDAWHVGVLEGGVMAFGRTPETRVRVLSLCDADIEITWR